MVPVSLRASSSSNSRRSFAVSMPCFSACSMSSITLSLLILSISCDGDIETGLSNFQTNQAAPSTKAAMSDM